MTSCVSAGITLSVMTPCVSAGIALSVMTPCVSAGIALSVMISSSALAEILSLLFNYFLYYGAGDYKRDRLFFAYATSVLVPAVLLW